METGTKISLVAHGTLLGIAMFGGPLFSSDQSRPIRISEVSMISSAEFAALGSRSPATVVALPEQMQPTLQTESSAVSPTADTAPDPNREPAQQSPATPDSMPDLTAIRLPEQPSLIVQPPDLDTQDMARVGATLQMPDAPVSDRQTNGQRQPDKLAMVQPQARPAPRVDTRAAEKPATDATPSPEIKHSTTPDATATQPVQKSTETAPRESSTEIVTEPEVDPNAAAPVKTSPPRGRPSNLAAKAKQAVKAQAKLVAAAKLRTQKEAQAKAIEAALLAATSQPQPTTPSAPTGPPLTSGEKGGLVLAVQQCWSVPVGLQNASELVVVLSVELTREGKLAGNPVLIDPTGPLQPTTRRAFEAGRRALMRCAPYDLPAEKYEQWRQLEVVFNPRKMVVK